MAGCDTNEMNVTICGEKRGVNYVKMAVAKCCMNESGIFYLKNTI